MSSTGKQQVQSFYMKTMLMTSKQEITSSQRGSHKYVLTHFSYAGDGLYSAFLFQICYHPILQCVHKQGAYYKRFVFFNININWIEFSTAISWP